MGDIEIEPISVSNQNPMTKLEQLRKVIVEAVPEIGGPENIKKGTILRHNEGWETTAIGPVDEHGGVSVTNGYGPASTFGIVASRPIRLADIFLALQPILSTVSQGTCSQYMCLLIEGASWRGENICWNLRQDDLFQQSPETTDFLHSLLCPSTRSY